MKVIQLDGSSGGGQMLRTALSLAMITGQPFRMTGIRGKRPKPGLMRQHLTCVKAACEISGGSADGAEIGSTEIVFRAGKVKGGNYHFAIGTAGSTSLLFQCLLPALLHADGPSIIRLEGGTHNPQAPPFEFLDQVFLPAISRMGAEVELSLLERGFAPAGGGVIEAKIQPIHQWKPIALHERTADENPSIRVFTRNLPVSIAGRMLDSLIEKQPSENAIVETVEPGPGRGVYCVCSVKFEEGTHMVTGLGEHGVTAERVAHRTAKAMRDFLGSKAPVGKHLADQLLLPLALAGSGSFTTMIPDSHVSTNISVIQAFLPVTIESVPPERGRMVIRIA